MSYNQKAKIGGQLKVEIQKLARKHQNATKTEKEEVDDFFKNSPDSFLEIMSAKFVTQEKETFGRNPQNSLFKEDISQKKKLLREKLKIITNDLYFMK